LKTENRWFGKNCKHQCCQWEETEQTGGPEFQEATPSLIFCDHKENTNECEGNCTLGLCPLVKEAKAVHSGPGVESGKYCAFCGRGIGFWTGPDESPCGCEIHKKKLELPDVDEVVQELESFRIHLPLHTRDESMPVCNLVIGKLWAMDVDTIKYKTALEAIHTLTNPDHHREECECCMCQIRKLCDTVLNGDGKQEKVLVEDRACSNCKHVNVFAGDQPCTMCIDALSNWEQKK